MTSGIRVSFQGCAVFLRRVQLAIAPPLLAACAALSACGGPATGDVGAGMVAVQPRLVVDGTVELGARSTREWQIVLDDVLFFAPEARHERGGSGVALTEADDALLFRYDPRSHDGFGGVVGGERHWEVSPEGELVFRFAPLDGDAPTVEKLEDDSGVTLDSLAGHTAVVHGTLVAQRATAGDAAIGDGADPCDGAPDGNPASCGTGEVSEGDPDGNPAEPTPASDGDPDGNPAKSDGKVDEGDPDGNPAKPVPVDGDPDGNPSKPIPGADDDEDVRKGALAAAPLHDDSDNVALLQRARVPFEVVLNKSFELRVPAEDLFADALARDEVMPIDLHLQLDELFSDDLVRVLNNLAAKESERGIVVEAPQASARGLVSLDVSSEGVRKSRRQAVTGSGIRVTGFNH
jgi:hypothetical protein